MTNPPAADKTRCEIEFSNVQKSLGICFILKSPSIPLYQRGKNLRDMICKGGRIYG